MFLFFLCFFLLLLLLPLPFARRFASCACATLFGNCLSVREYTVCVCVCASVTVGQVIELERRQVTCGLLSLLFLRSCFFSGLFLCFNARFAAALALVDVSVAVSVSVSVSVTECAVFNVSAEAAA